MKNLKIPLLNCLLLIIISSSVFSCSEDGVNGSNGKDGLDGSDFTPEPIVTTIFENKSNLKPLVTIHSGFSDVKAYSLLSSSDILANGFQLLGAQDGAGLLKDPKSDGFIQFLVYFLIKI
jgi:hypothetical protein